MTTMPQKARRSVAVESDGPGPATDVHSQPSGVSDGGCVLDPWNAAYAGNTDLELAHFPSALLLRVANVIHHESSAVYARKHGLTLAEWRILGRLHESAPIRRAALCRVAFLDKAQVTRVLRGLVERGLAKTRKDPAHAHRIIVDITASGRGLAEEVFPEALAEQFKLLGALTPGERATTYSALCKLLAVYGVKNPSAALEDEEPPE